ncbi:hypothetical protein [Shewanella youngdeokensis]|uniref:Uncharacterized protein n=1 Tax=Shewanella youngdeokensis TaxID=2999068 RepID=A0ABZ0K087_9GAMM|nr:hypothetical protein RGE70_03050 [Shewanella sp. DAU334]
MTFHMLKPLLLCGVLLSPGFVYAAMPAAGTHNGQVSIKAGLTMAWDESSQQWLTIENFWRQWANSRGGLTWPASETYPPYEQVKEQDTFLVQLDGGTCLMEFWHQRWRRANDVRRWDDAFNRYSACPKVFD